MFSDPQRWPKAYWPVCQMLALLHAPAKNCISMGAKSAGLRQHSDGRNCWAYWCSSIARSLEPTKTSMGGLTPCARSCLSARSFPCSLPTKTSLCAMLLAAALRSPTCRHQCLTLATFALADC